MAHTTSSFCHILLDRINPGYSIVYRAHHTTDGYETPIYSYLDAIYGEARVRAAIATLDLHAVARNHTDQPWFSPFISATPFLGAGYLFDRTRDMYRIRVPIQRLIQSPTDKHEVLIMGPIKTSETTGSWRVETLLNHLEFHRLRRGTDPYANPISTEQLESLDQKLVQIPTDVPRISLDEPRNYFFNADLEELRRVSLLGPLCNRETFFGSKNPSLVLTDGTLLSLTSQKQDALTNAIYERHKQKRFVKTYFLRDGRVRMHLLQNLLYIAEVDGKPLQPVIGIPPMGFLLDTTSAFATFEEHDRLGRLWRYEPFNESYFKAARNDEKAAYKIYVKKDDELVPMVAILQADH